MIFYTYITTDAYKAWYHLGQGSLTINEWIPSFEELGEAISKALEDSIVNCFYIGSLIFLKLEATNASHILETAIGSLSGKGGEIVFKVVDKWRLSKFDESMTCVI